MLTSSLRLDIIDSARLCSLPDSDYPSFLLHICHLRSALFSVIITPERRCIMADYHFDFSFIKSGPPVVTLSATGIAFNAGSRALLGYPERIDIGYDSQAKAIGIRAHIQADEADSFEFEGRQKDGWVRINAKEFSRYLEQQTGIKFREKAKQFLPEFDEDSKILIVVLDEEHLK